MKKYSDKIESRLSGRHKKCIRFCGRLTGKKVLNIGCYNGWFEKGVCEKGPKELVGIDINDKFLKIARKRVGKARFIKASVLDIPFKDNSFDIVTMFDVLEHLPQDMEKKAILEIRRVLKRGGRLIISVPNANFLAKIFDPAWYFGHRHYSQRQLTQFLKKADFSLEQAEEGGRIWELTGMILLYFFKWAFGREAPLKSWFDKKRDDEYLKKHGFNTLFLTAVNHKRFLSN